MEDVKILYSDNHIIVVQKPAGLLSIPGRGEDKKDCLTSRIKDLFPNSIEQPAVHRLDMATSGLMVLALTKTAHRNLSIQFQNREVYKEYVAILENKIDKKEGIIELPFRLDINNRPHQIYDLENGKMGITKWRILDSKRNNPKILFIPSTGRTHQLRVHSAHKLGLNSPIVGDNLYGSKNKRLMLHATLLAFNHPENGERILFNSEPPF